MDAERSFCDGRKSEDGKATRWWTAFGLSLLCALVYGFRHRGACFTITPEAGLSRPQPQRQPNTPTTRKLSVTPAKARVFVYDVPQLDHKELIECYKLQSGGVPPWQDEHEERAQNTAEVWLHRALLVHPWRVLDPEQADIFYIPIYPMVSQVQDWGRDFQDYRHHSDPNITHHTCGGLTHAERMEAAVDFLRHESIYFNRFGGADHLLVCGWWASRIALSPQHRMILRRVVLGTPERLLLWNRPGCGVGRLIAVPYTASKFLTSSDTLGGRSSEKRDITFFFVGSSRGRPERENLNVSRDAFSWFLPYNPDALGQTEIHLCFCSCRQRLPEGFIRVVLTVFVCAT